MCFTSSNLFSQSKPQNKKSITASFLFNEVEFKEVAVMSNVLKIKNNNGKNYTFNVSLSLPPGWKTLNNQEREYTLKPNDSVFVPVRVLATDKKAKGGTKYSIAAYVNTNEGKQISFARFVAGRPKITNWQMRILPRPRIYLLNGENEANFQVNLSNDGDEDQEILVSMNKIGKGFLVLDSAGNINKKSYFETTLSPYSDTTISYKIKILTQERNQTRVDVWGYSPSAAVTEKRYGLFIRGSEIRFDNKGGGSKGKKADFVKLANSIDFVKLNSFAKAGNSVGSIPLTMFMNLTNILGEQPILTYNFQGNTRTGKTSSLNYQIQTGFSYFKYSNAFLTQRLSVNFGYTNKRYFLGFAVGGNNKMFMLGYNIGKHSNIFATHSRESILKKSNNDFYSILYGFSHKYFSSSVNATTAFSYGRNSSKGINASITLRPFGATFFGFNGGFVDNIINNEVSSRMYNAGFGIGTSIKRYSTNLNANNSFQKFSNASDTVANKIFNLNWTNIYTSKRGKSFNLNTSLSMFNYKTDIPNIESSEFLTFNNNLQINLKSRYGKLNWSPLFFVNYSKVNMDTILSGGCQFNISRSNLESNFYYGTNFRFAYNELLDNKQLGIFFTSTVNFFARYKVWNAMATYNYGGLGIGEMVNNLQNSKSYSQMARLSVGHQYQFKNLKLILENNPTYTYLTALKRHSLSIFSQIYYFTNSGYRFAFNTSLNVTSGYSYKYNYAGPNQIRATQTDERLVSKNVVFGVSVKKDFSIPLPKRFRKLKSCDAKFVVFLDVNGNKIMDEGEVPVENVVLRMNDFEVITDDKGMASFLNMSFQRYKVQVFPLIDMGSWFPNVDDSVDVCGPDLMYLPFSKGVQVTGGVELDREAFTGELFEKLDVSRFKIYLIDTAGKVNTAITDNRGNFNFYVPYAKYKLRFDEKALGNQFYLAENDIDLDLSTGIESYYHNFMIIERKRKVKRKIFGPDGKVTYVEEEAGSKKSDKDKQGIDADGQDKDKSSQKDDLANSKGKEARDGKDGMQSISIDAKMDKLDSLINVLNQLILRAATRIEVRTIVKQEMQDLIDELNASFTIKVDELPKSKSPTGLLLQLVRLNKVTETKLPNGNKVYTSGDYRNVSDAEKFCRDYQTSGFKKARVVKIASVKKGN